MEWWWGVPAAAGLCMLGVLYRSRNPRMAGREGGPAFETFYDVRECLRGGVTPILPEGWQFWRYEILRGDAAGNATELGQENVAKLQIGDRVWLLIEPGRRQSNLVKATSRDGFLGFVKVGSDCRQALAAGQIAAFVENTDNIITRRPHVELLVLQCTAPLESSKRELQTAARWSAEQSSGAKAQGFGK